MLHINTIQNMVLYMYMSIHIFYLNETKCFVFIIEMCITVCMKLICNTFLNKLIDPGLQKTKTNKKRTTNHLST